MPLDYLDLVVEVVMAIATVFVWVRELTELVVVHSVLTKEIMEGFE